jgi:DUF1009 family protein
VNRLGLIAGNGTFPLAVAEAARTRGIEIIAVAHVGETEPALEGLCSELTWIRVGEIEKMVATFKSAKISEAAMAGGISRVRQQHSFAPDERALRMMLRIGKMSDDAVLRGLAEELESEQIAIIDPVYLLDRAVVEAGRLAGPEPRESQLSDLKLAFGVLNALGNFDIGQAVMVRDGVVAAIEAIEGTDAALKRAAELCGKGVVVAKGAKPSQDLRFDRPAIGPRTIAVLSEVGAAVIGLEVRRTMVLEREKTLALADRHQITVYGYEPRT